MLYIVEEHVYLYAKLGTTVRFGSSSLINGSDEMLRCELFQVSHVCSIKDGALRFCLVVCEEEALHDHICLIRNRCQ